MQLRQAISTFFKPDKLKIMIAFIAKPEIRKARRKYKIIDQGNGEVLLLLHGLFGSLSNWNSVLSSFSNEYRVVIPILPICDESLGEANLENLLEFLELVIEENYLGNNLTIVGNSLGGHLGLLYTLKHPNNVKRLVLSGSSDLYENTMGGSFPRVKNYDFIKEKVEYTFYRKEVVTKELIDDVYETVQSIEKTLRIIRMARSAQKHNLANELQEIKVPTLLIWGINDEVTPLDVAFKFRELIPNAELKAIGQCGHVPMMEHPQLFNQYLQEFISNNPF